MSKEKQNEEEWAKEVILGNTEGLKELAEEKPAKRMRKNRFYQKLLKFYRKYFTEEEEKVSTIDL